MHNISLFPFLPLTKPSSLPPHTPWWVTPPTCFTISQFFLCLTLPEPVFSVPQSKTHSWPAPAESSCLRMMDPLWLPLTSPPDLLKRSLQSSGTCMTALMLDLLYPFAKKIFTIGLAKAADSRCASVLIQGLSSGQIIDGQEFMGQLWGALSPQKCHTWLMEQQLPAKRSSAW